MKKVLMGLTAFVLTGFGATAVYAATSDTCQMSVTITTSKDVTITNDPLTFGSVAAGAGNYAISTTSATVTNTGTTTESYRLQLTDKPGTWSVREIAGNPGNEEIKLLALFATKTPVTGDFGDTEDLVKNVGGMTDASATTYAVNTEGADAQGLNCTAGAVRHLWFKFMAPSSTILSGVQLLTVTVTAF